MPTMLIPCGDRIDCPGTDSPFVNLTAEAPDVAQFWAAAYAQPIMPLGAGWGRFGGVAIGTSDVSQDDAEVQARLTVDANTITPPDAERSDITPPPGDPTNEPPIPDDLPRDPARRPIIIRRRTPPPRPVVVSPPEPNPAPFTPTPRNPPPPFFGNDEQTCTRVCASGTIFTVVVPASTVFSRRSLIEANAMAQSRACYLASTQPICFGEILYKTCANEAYSSTIPVTSGSPVSWNLIGSLPPGLTFSNGLIIGTPTVPGTTTFDVEAFDASGNVAMDTFTIQVVAITTTSLPGGAVGTPYFATLTQMNGTLPVDWKIESGSLPDGLSLDGDTGVISGTPTANGVVSFTVSMTDTPS